MHNTAGPAQVPPSPTALGCDLIAGTYRLRHVLGQGAYDPKYVRPPVWKANDAARAIYADLGVKEIGTDIYPGDGVAALGDPWRVAGNCWGWTGPASAMAS